jgi:hypothetical protein
MLLNALTFGENTKMRKIIIIKHTKIKKLYNIMEKFIVYNAIRTPDQTILESKHVHDYQSYVDKNGEIYILDGGCGGYTRRSVNIIEAENISLYSDAPHEQIREVVSRGSRGKSGREELKYILLKNIDDEYLQAIIDYEETNRPTNKFLPIYRAEQKFRKNEN